MIQIESSTLENRLGTPWSETALHKALLRLPSIGLRGPWVAGGAVRRTLTGEPLSTDIDFSSATNSNTKNSSEMPLD